LGLAGRSTYRRAPDATSSRPGARPLDSLSPCCLKSLITHEIRPWSVRPDCRSHHEDIKATQAIPVPTSLRWDRNRTVDARARVFGMVHDVEILALGSAGGLIHANTAPRWTGDAVFLSKCRSCSRGQRSGTRSHGRERPGGPGAGASASSRVRRARVRIAIAMDRPFGPSARGTISVAGKKAIRSFQKARKSPQPADPHQSLMATSFACFLRVLRPVTRRGGEKNVAEQIPSWCPFQGQVAHLRPHHHVVLGRWC